MSQAQPTIEKIHSLRKKQETALKSLTLIGYLEGTSFLLLLFIAMPLKYMLDIPEGVKYIGMAHGILFITYIIILIGSAIKMKIFGQYLRAYSAHSYLLAHLYSIIY